ncbi:MAG: hypothetical protein NVSMB70_08490 [Chamaesiphon sp.]
MPFFDKVISQFYQQVGRGFTSKLDFENMIKTLVILLIQGYRTWISPLFLPSCRFHPTCSQYALEAVERFGPWYGGCLAIRRIFRCHPFHPGGYDPVPSVTSSETKQTK